MKIVCIGGGPAGLYFGLLMKLQDPANEVTVIERNRPYDTFGWGVVFSDATMQNLREADPVSAQTIGDAFNHWDDIDIHFKGRSLRSGGHGFIGIGRKKLLNILQARCEEVGVKLVFEQFIQDDQAIAREYDADLVIASDGINSQVRTRYADTFRPDIDQRNCRFVWLGTKRSSTPSPSPLCRPSTAGSRRTPTATKTACPPSSWKRLRKPGRPPASSR